MSKQTTSKVPQIRFKGFEGDWEEKTLGDEPGEIVAGGDVDKKLIRDKGKYPVLANALTNDGIVGYYDDEFRVKAPAVTVTGRGDVGHAKARSTNFTPVVRLLSVKTSHDVHFLECAINLHSVLVESTGVPQLTVPQFKQYKITFPKDTNEETRIGQYFRALDRLIGLHQRKHDKLVTLKKGMLQKMFPQPSATTPEIRFKGFSKEWEKRTLHHLTNRYDNLRIPVSASNRIPGNTPYYGANGIQDYVDGYTHEGEFILVAEDGANDLKNYPVQYVSGKVWVNNHAHVLQGKAGLAETRFLKYAFAQINFEAFLVGGGRSKLNAETMMQMELYAPEDIEEQQKISTYFRTLDELITKHATQLQKLQQIKSACLEKMFV